MSEAALGRISNNAQEMTVGEMLRLPISPRLLTCATMHQEIVPAETMRLIAVELATGVINRAVEHGVYVDFRSRNAIETARQFAHAECSLGELRVACVRAKAVQDTVMAPGDKKVEQVAALAVSVCDPDSRSAILRTLADALDLFHDKADEQRYIRLIAKMLQEVA